VHESRGLASRVHRGEFAAGELLRSTNASREFYDRDGTRWGVNMSVWWKCARGESCAGEGLKERDVGTHARTLRSLRAAFGNITRVPPRYHFILVVHRMLNKDKMIPGYTRVMFPNASPVGRIGSPIRAANSYTRFSHAKWRDSLLYLQIFIVGESLLPEMATIAFYSTFDKLVKRGRGLLFDSEINWNIFEKITDEINMFRNCKRLCDKFAIWMRGVYLARNCVTRQIQF